MKLFLAASLILNVVLLGAAVRRSAHNGQIEFARPLRTQVAPAAREFNFFKRRPPGPSVPATPWQAIESRDPAHLIANLRAVGCPERTIRDILVIRVCREFQTRLQAAHDEAARKQLWWRGSPYSRQSLELSQLRSTLRRERDDSLETLFGEPASRQVLQVMATRGPAAVGREFLPTEKKSQLRELEQRYRQLFAEVTYPVGDPVDDDDRGELVDLQRRKRAEIEALLTPQELEEFAVRESAAARYVLRNLPEAGSEAEFRAMVRAAQEGGITDESRLASPLASRFGMAPPNEVPQRREEAQRKAVEARVKELLGEQRFAQMLQAEAERDAAEQARWEAEQRAPKR